MLFPSLITCIYEASGVKFVSSDKRIKNEGALTVRTVGRIAGEYVAATTPEHLIVTKLGQVIGIGKML